MVRRWKDRNGLADIAGAARFAYYPCMRLTEFSAVYPPASAGRKARGAARKSRQALRQWLLHELERSYSYPSDWLQERVRLTGESRKAFFGFSLLTNKGDPFFWAAIEPGDSGLAEKRLREQLRASPVARSGISTDGTVMGTRVLRQRSDSEGCDFIPDLEVFTRPAEVVLPGLFRAPGGQSASPGQQLAPISEDLEDVFFEAHSHIRDIDGLHADEALDELCKVLYAKLYDEETTPAGEPYTLQRGPCGTVEEFAAIIRRRYQDASENRSPIRLSSAALVKVVQELEPYSLTQSSIDVKGRAFQRVLAPALRAGMGQYFTPLQIVQLIVDVMQPAVTELILDPFAGSAHFLTQSLDAVRARAKPSDGKRVSEFASCKLHGIEKSDRMVRVAMTDMRLHGDGQGNIRCTDALLAFPNYPDLHPESFDVVMTNPPFGSLLGSETLGGLGHFALAASRKSVPLEVLGLERSIQFLRPGGRLGIVLPEGILANRGSGYVREWLAEQVKVRAIVSLPIETFAPFGATIKTAILFARKWKKGEARTTRYNVHLCRIDNIGYDATGRRRSGSEMEAVAQAVTEFIRKEGW